MWSKFKIGTKFSMSKSNMVEGIKLSYCVMSKSSMVEGIKLSYFTQYDKEM